MKSPYDEMMDKAIALSCDYPSRTARDSSGEDAEPWQNLANAIVEQAAKDYLKARAILNDNHFDRDATDTARSTLRFFRSKWYKTLTSIDPEWLIRTLNAEVSE